jgi:hypothetical protein
MSCSRYLGRWATAKNAYVFRGRLIVSSVPCPASSGGPPAENESSSTLGIVRVGVGGQHARDHEAHVAGLVDEIGLVWAARGVRVLQREDGRRQLHIRLAQHAVVVRRRDRKPVSEHDQRERFVNPVRRGVADVQTRRRRSARRSRACVAAGGAPESSSVREVHQGCASRLFTPSMAFAPNGRARLLCPPGGVIASQL